MRKTTKIVVGCITGALIFYLIVHYLEHSQNCYRITRRPLQEKCNCTVGSQKQISIEDEAEMSGTNHNDCTNDNSSIPLLNMTRKVTVGLKHCRNVNILDVPSTDLSVTNFFKVEHGISKWVKELVHPNVFMYIHDPANDKAVSRRIFETGMWEPPIARTIVAALRHYPDAGLLDIGANVGFHSLLAPILGRKVVSVEPLPDNYLRIAKSAVDNNFVDLFTILPNIVSSTANGSFRIKINRNKNIGGSKVEEVSSDRECLPPLCLKCITISDIVDFIPFTDVILKMDIESKETDAFKGSDLLFKKKNVKVIVMEWDKVERIRENSLYLQQKFRALGFKPYFPQAGNDLSSLHPITANLSEKKPGDVVWKKSDP